MKLTKAQISFLTMLAALFAVAIVFSVLSLFVHRTGPYLQNFENLQQHGWPMPYYQTGCWEAAEACYQFTSTDWSLAAGNILAWFGFSALVWSLYYISRLKNSRRR